MAADFWDTSAAAKLYVNESGSDWTATRAAQRTVVVSELTHVEIASFLGRRCAEGEFDIAARDELYLRYLNDARGFEFIPLRGSLWTAAAQIALAGASSRRVRSLDAIQLATAQWWFEQARILNIQSGVFVVADSALAEAAVAIGLHIENPEDYE